jgi:hypothetical protein
MTELAVPAGVKQEQVTVTVNEFGEVDSGHQELLRRINMVLESRVIIPIVNIEPETARLIIKRFGGRIVSEPEFDPNAGDVR